VLFVVLTMIHLDDSLYILMVGQGAPPMLVGLGVSRVIVAQNGFLVVVPRLLRTE